MLGEDQQKIMDRLIIQLFSILVDDSTTPALGAFVAHTHTLNCSQRYTIYEFTANENLFGKGLNLKAEEGA